MSKLSEIEKALTARKTARALEEQRNFSQQILATNTGYEINR